MSNPDSTSTCRTPTRAVNAEVSVTGGRTEEVTLFLSTLSETHDGPETMEDALNHDRDFLPVRTRETEQTFLMRRMAVRTVTISDDDSEVVAREQSLAAVDLVRLELDGGEMIEGTIATVSPPEKSRLSDFFNYSKAMFVPVAVDDGVTYVNRNFISMVWW